MNEVLEEVALTMDKTYLFFVDDHLVNNSKKLQQRAIAIFKGMVEKGLQRPWFTQASMNVVDNEEVVKWAHKSGCCPGLNADMEWKNMPYSKYLRRTDWIIKLFSFTVWRKFRVS